MHQRIKNFLTTTASRLKPPPKPLCRTCNVALDVLIDDKTGHPVFERGKAVFQCPICKHGEIMPDPTDPVRANKPLILNVFQWLGICAAGILFAFLTDIVSADSLLDAISLSAYIKRTLPVAAAILALCSLICWVKVMNPIRHPRRGLWILLASVLTAASLAALVGPMFLK